MAVGRPASPGRSGLCPFLRTSHVLFCSAAKETKFVPFSESLTSSCQTWSHEYCDLYLSLARPRSWAAAPEPREAAPGHGDKGAAGGSSEVVELPDRLAFASNHLWIDLRDDESCHIGADAFLASLVGRIDAVDFVTARGICRPEAVLSVGGADLRLVFPNPIHVTHVNTALRSDPGKIADDPYGRGWLFAGRETCAATAPGLPGADGGLRRGAEARLWMDGELRRAARFVHETAMGRGPDGVPVMNDGGLPAAHLADHLSRGDKLRLFAWFFSPENAQEAS